MLRVPAVKADALILDKNKMGIVVNMVVLTNRRVNCACSVEDHHITNGPPKDSSRGRLIDQLDHSLNHLNREVGIIPRGSHKPGTGLAKDGWEHIAALRDEGNEGVTIALRIGHQQQLHPVTIDVTAARHVEILGALVDFKVHHWVDDVVQLCNNSISKSLGLKMVAHVEAGDDDMPQELDIIR